MQLLLTKTISFCSLPLRVTAPWYYVKGVNLPSVRNNGRIPLPFFFLTDFLVLVSYGQSLPTSVHILSKFNIRFGMLTASRF